MRRAKLGWGDLKVAKAAGPLMSFLGLHRLNAAWEGNWISRDGSARNDIPRACTWYCHKQHFAFFDLAITKLVVAMSTVNGKRGLVLGGYIAKGPQPRLGMKVLTGRFRVLECLFSARQ
jgi:hypothetical protein